MTNTQMTEITLTVTGLCPMIFDSDNERAAFGIFHDSDHQTVLKVDNVDWSQSFNGMASLTVHRAPGSQRQNQIVRKADNVVTDPNNMPAGDLSFSHVVDIQKDLYGGLHLPMQTGLLKARLVLNDGEFSVSKLFNGGSPGAPPRKVWFVPETNLSKVVYENYVAEELTVRIYLEKDDFAFLAFDNGDFVYLYGDQSHSIVMSNMCDPAVIASGQDDFILQYKLYRMGDHPRVIPQYDPPGTIAPRQGTSMCIGGSNCIPPGSCT